MNKLIKYFVFIRQLQRSYLQPHTPTASSSPLFLPLFLVLQTKTNAKTLHPIEDKSGKRHEHPTSKQSQKIKGAFVRAIVPSLSVLLLS
jgi:hypothetical protein